MSTAVSMAPLRVWMSAPPSSCLSSAWPSRATTGGPATNIADVFVITEKCVEASRAAPNPATEPSPSPTTGTSARLAVMRQKPLVVPMPPGRLDAPVVSMVLTEPPPPEPSMMRTMGSRNSAAMSSAISGLLAIDASAEPPRTVKSSPTTTTARSSMRPRPNTQLAGVTCVTAPCASYSPMPDSAPTSWKLPASSSRWMRSRTVSRPASCWRLTLSAPPIASAIAVRRASSSSSLFQLMRSFLSLV